jgi:6-pyruvoyltetrahydropterin/6-carboxytetrahydropterin synthase
MPIRLERDFRFEAAHRLPRVPEGHRCRRLHGHSYAVTLVLEGEPDADLGWLLDFAAIDERALPIISELDHQVLNEVSGLENPTSELLAVWLWRRLLPQLPALVEVSVSETPTSRCRYRGPGG